MHHNGRKAAPGIVFLASLLIVVRPASPISAQTAGKPAAQGANEDAPLSEGDLAHLRDAVVPDLRKAVAIFNDDPGVTNVSDEFKSCRITPIGLGALGRGVVVEWNPMQTPNASMINLYLPDHGAYRKLIAGSGFGPTVLPGSRPVPDLVFGGTMGVCHASYTRYRFERGKYSADACDQETEGKDGSCAIVACENKLPTFPNPFPD